MIGHVYKILKTDTHEVRGTIFMPLEEAWLFHCTPLGILLDPHPRDITPESEGWISVKKDLPRTGDIVKVWGLSECDEKAILMSIESVEKIHPANTFEVAGAKYFWRVPGEKNGVWKPSLITHWKPNK